MGRLFHANEQRMKKKVRLKQEVKSAAREITFIQEFKRYNWLAMKFK